MMRINERMGRNNLNESGEKGRTRCMFFNTSCVIFAGKGCFHKIKDCPQEIESRIHNAKKTAE